MGPVSDGVQYNYYEIGTAHCFVYGFHIPKCVYCGKNFQARRETKVVEQNKEKVSKACSDWFLINPNK